MQPALNFHNLKTPRDWQYILTSLQCKETITFQLLLQRGTVRFILNNSLILWKQPPNYHTNWTRTLYLCYMERKYLRNWPAIKTLVYIKGDAFCWEERPKRSMIPTIFFKGSFIPSNHPWAVSALIGYSRSVLCTCFVCALLLRSFHLIDSINALYPQPLLYWQFL